jgi:hypothetical protein
MGLKRPALAQIGLLNVAVDYPLAAEAIEALVDALRPHCPPIKGLKLSLGFRPRIREVVIDA